MSCQRGAQGKPPVQDVQPRCQALQRPPFQPRDSAAQMLGVRFKIVAFVSVLLGGFKVASEQRAPAVACAVIAGRLFPRGGSKLSRTAAAPDPIRPPRTFAASIPGEPIGPPTRAGCSREIVPAAPPTTPAKPRWPVQPSIRPRPQTPASSIARDAYLNSDDATKAQTDRLWHFQANEASCRNTGSRLSKSGHDVSNRVRIEQINLGFCRIFAASPRRVFLISRRAVRRLSTLIIE